MRNEPGSDGVVPVFDCPLLGEDGRCTDYDGRPELCRLYEAGSDPICAEYTHTLRGIPIVVV